MAKQAVQYFLEEYPAGTVMCRQGEKGDWVYVVQSGLVEIRREVNEHEFLLAMLSAGEFFGEMAVINDEPRSATAVIRDDAQLLAISRNMFLELFHTDPEIAGRVARIMSRRLEQSNRWLEVLLYKQPAERMVHSLRMLVEDKAASERAAHRGAVYLPFTLRELADRAGVTREQAIDVVEQLAGDGLITSASAVEIDGPGYVVAEAGLLLDFLGVSGQVAEPALTSGAMYQWSQARANADQAQMSGLF